ncbi:MAG: hypothetical protein GY772_17140 [bacterium]|nr:hypothetical protein [bacterium]
MDTSTCQLDRSKRCPWAVIGIGRLKLCCVSSHASVQTANANGFDRARVVIDRARVVIAANNRS